MNKKSFFIIFALILTLAFGTKVFANLTLSDTGISMTGSTSGNLTLQPAAITTSYTLTLPADDGTSGQVLTTNGSGVTSWTTVAGGGITNGAGANVIPKSDGTNLVASQITDDGSIVIIGSGATQLYMTEGEAGAKASNGVILLGDTNESGNSTILTIDDTIQTITATANVAINLDSRGGMTTIGDVNGNFDGNTLSISGSGTIDINGNSVFHGPIQIEDNDIFGTSAGGSVLGTATFPFGSIYLGSAATNNIRLTGDEASGARVATFPDRTGTVKVGVDYKVYNALISQTGTNNPVATVLENTLDGTPSLSRGGVGYYLVTLPDAFTFNKTAVFIGSAHTQVGSHMLVRSSFLNEESVLIYTKDNSNTLTDGFLANTVLEIRVYP